MLNIKIVIASIFLISCQIQPEFYIDGKPYYTTDKCVKDTTYTEYCYHYGYNVFSGKFEWHWGFDSKNECLKSEIDTIEIVK